MTRKSTTQRPQKSSAGAAKGPRSNGGGSKPRRRDGAARDPAATQELIRQIIENVAVPELLRRHGSLPPTRRSRAVHRPAAAVDLAQLVRLLKRPERTAASDYLDGFVKSSRTCVRSVMIDILPRAAELLEAEVAEGRASTAIGCVALSNLKMIALRWLEIATLDRAPRPTSGRVALISMIDDAASFDLAPFEYILWAENYEVENLDGVSPRALMDAVHSSAFDCVMVGCRRSSLRQQLSRWLRAAQIVARGRPRFVSIASAQSSSEREPIPGCTSVVYGPRDAASFMSELMVARSQLPVDAPTAFQISDLVHYRSQPRPCPEHHHRRMNPASVHGAAQSRFLTRH